MKSLVLYLLTCTTLIAGDLSVQVDEYQVNGMVTVKLTNTSSHSVRVWAQDNSWGWSNWYFQFFEGNEILIFTRNPKEGFTVNIPHYYQIEPGKALPLAFNLKDGSWVCTHVKIWPAYPSKGDDDFLVKGGIAAYAVSNSPDATSQRVYSGILTQSFQ